MPLLKDLVKCPFPYFYAPLLSNSLIEGLEKEVSVHKLIIVELVFDNSSVIRIILWFCNCKLFCRPPCNVP